MKLSETTEPVRSDRFRYINERWGQLSRLVEDTELRALRYLTLTNAGGSAAVLSFLGTSEKARDLSGPKLALFFFVLGLIISGVLIAYSAHLMAHLHVKWKNDVRDYYNDVASWSLILDNDEARTSSNITTYLLGYAAFLCFVVGSTLGISSLIFHDKGFAMEELTGLVVPAIAICLIIIVFLLLLISFVRNWKQINVSFSVLQSFEKSALWAGLSLFVLLPLLKSHPQSTSYFGEVSISILSNVAIALFILGAVSFLKSVHKNKNDL